jgi:hypothetical protein
MVASPVFKCVPLIMDQQVDVGEMFAGAQKFALK